MTKVVNAQQLMPGFEQPVEQAQQVFRAAMKAMASPGLVCQTVGVEALGSLQPATLAVALTLLDGDTPVWLDEAADRTEVRDNLRFHCNCPFAQNPSVTAFAIVANPLMMPALEAFPIGDELYPDRSATLILQVGSLGDGESFALSGPGIKDKAVLKVEGLPGDFIGQWQQNHALYPCGVDLILTSGHSMAALPRSTRIEAAPCT